LKLRTQLLLFLFLFGFAPLLALVSSNLPFVLDRMELFFYRAHLQNLRADFRDLDEYLASRHEMVRLLAKLPEPSLILGQGGSSEEDIDKARVRYTRWVNQILRSHLDMFQILYLDSQGRPRFWLELNPATGQWEPTIRKPEMPSAEFLRQGMRQAFGGVSVSKIKLNPSAALADPRHFMTLHLMSIIVGRASDSSPVRTMGAVVATIDVGGMARAYRNTLWVTNDGAYLQERLRGNNRPQAFEDFKGLEKIFAKGKLDLWEGRGGQIIWVPMFMTEESGPLWVGRAVDPSPVFQFRNNLIIRALTVVVIALIVVFLFANWIAVRLSRFGASLTEKIGRVLQKNEPVRFDWVGPHEIRDLGRQLTALAETHARHAQQQREHARQLEESNRYKSEFLANVSHELRTPLNSILLLSKMLAEQVECLNETEKKQLQVIHEAGMDLRGLIDDILDLSKIEAGRISFHLEKVQMQQLVEELIELVKPQFDAKGLSLVAEYREGAPRELITDPAKVRQILKNFLSNALKFTHQGGVVIRVYAQDEAGGGPLCIAVQDSGIGIPADKHALIFEAFQQADGSTSREYGGTGLGLSISRELAHLMGGEIQLQSSEGRGSTFTLCLPLEFELVEQSDLPRGEAPAQLPGAEPMPVAGQTPRTATTGSAPPANSRPFHGERVLLVDDDLRNLLSLTPLLESWGLQVTAAGDGREALETLEEDQDFALVLMDIMMPVLDGYDTIQQIRSNRRLRDLVIIALTAKTTAEDRERCIEAGADDFIPKPVDPEALKELIYNHLPD